jgi:hypothetical protein
MIDDYITIPAHHTKYVGKTPQELTSHDAAFLALEILDMIATNGHNMTVQEYRNHVTLGYALCVKLDGVIVMGRRSLDPSIFVRL